MRYLTFVLTIIVLAVLAPTIVTQMFFAPRYPTGKSEFDYTIEALGIG